MRDLAPAIALASLFCLAALPAAGGELRSRFGYCAPPFAPPCVATAGKDGRSTEACEQEVERYVASVFTYRACMAAETERAVREANATIQAMRCARDPALCPKPADPPPPKAKKGKRQAGADG